MITIQQIDKYLHVDITEGTVFWKHHDQRPDLIGRECGSANQGYRRMRLCGYEFYRCQLIWFVAYGEWPTFTIDHADANTLNDSIDNLRKATKGENAANSGLNSRNTSGYKGVSFCSITGRWRASILINGHSINLGRYTTEIEAHDVYLKVAKYAWGSFVRE